MVSRARFEVLEARFDSLKVLVDRFVTARCNRISGQKKGLEDLFFVQVLATRRRFKRVFWCSFSGRSRCFLLGYQVR